MMLYLFTFLWGIHSLCIHTYNKRIYNKRKACQIKYMCDRLRKSLTLRQHSRNGVSPCLLVRPAETDDEESKQVVRTAIQHGINLIDTAPW